MTILIPVLFSLLGCAEAEIVNEPLEGGAVVVLIMDGVRAEESFADVNSSITEEHASEALMIGAWTHLIPLGARAVNAWNLGATVTAPAHVTLTSGRRQPLANYGPTTDPGLYRPDLPGLVEALFEDGASSDEVVFIGNSAHMSTLTYSIWPDDEQEAATYIFVGDEGSEVDPSRKDAHVMSAALDYMAEHKPKFLLANLHKVDRAGHWGAPRSYSDAVKEIDNNLPLFWNTIQSMDEYRDNTTLIVMADHGRHDQYHASEPAWTDHGDSCFGCRSLPFLMLGPNIAEGVVTEEVVTQEDVAATIAAVLGLSLPWSEGRVLTEVFEGEMVEASPHGVASVVLSADHEVVSLYGDFPAERKGVFADGARLSTDEALVADAPALAQGELSTLACFKELLLNDPTVTTPWLMACGYNTGAGWERIPAPVDEVSPYWSAEIKAVGDDFVMVFPHNPNAITTSGVGGNEVGVRLATFNGAEWSQQAVSDIPTFPTDPSFVVDNEGDLLVAVAGGIGTISDRHTRRIFLWRGFLTEDGSYGFSTVSKVLLDSLNPGDRWRLEHPSLYYDESSGLFYLAAVGMSEQYSAVVVAESSNGIDWINERVVSGGGQAAPHLAAVWHQGQLMFVEVEPETGDLSLCSWSGVDVACTDLNTKRVQGLVTSGTVLEVVIQRDDDSWERVEALH